MSVSLPFGKEYFFNIRTDDGENSKAIICGAKFEVYL